ncbi:MAG: hypothetical protein HC859_10440, partial [Bacteroidia bacterium]|nr:hypothetical protein [Bacteroidia bacterium]
MSNVIIRLPVSNTSRSLWVNSTAKKRFIAAGEESYGYMVGDFVRDKDAVSACAFFAAMAASATDEGKS